MMIAPNSRACKEEKERVEIKGEYGRIWREDEGNADYDDYGGMMQSSQQHVAPCAKWVEWGLGTRGLIIMVAIWIDIPVEVTKKAGV